LIRKNRLKFAHIHARNVNLIHMLEKSLSYLALLKENNYREWYHENKFIYEEAKKEFETFVLSLIKEVKMIDNEVGYPEHPIKHILEFLSLRAAIERVNMAGIIFIWNPVMLYLQAVFGNHSRIF